MKKILIILSVFVVVGFVSAWISVLKMEAQTGDIVITSPVASEVWRAGGEYTVKWTAPALIPTVTILLTSDDGRRKVSIGSDVPNTGSHSVTVPNFVSELLGSDFKIYIYGGVYNAYSAFFSIVSDDSDGVIPSTRLVVGGNVKVVSDIADLLNVRERPYIWGKVQAKENANASGVVTDGPIVSNKYNWWKIRWSDGVEGWSAEGSEDGSEFWLERCLATGCPDTNNGSVGGDTGGDADANLVPNPDFSAGVGVIALDVLNVRNTASLTGGLIGTVNSGARGVVVAGPVTADGHVWWKVSWGSLRYPGWSAQEWLQKIAVNTSVDTTNTPPSSDGIFRIGDRVRQKALGAQLPVRSGHSTAGKVIGYQPFGALGTIMEGPVRESGWVWSRVDFDNGVDGWIANAEGWMEKVDSGGPSTTNQSPANIRVTGPSAAKINTVTNWYFEGTDPEGSNLLFVVDWGDGQSDNLSGSSGAAKSASHTYTKTGTFTVRLMVSDGNGGTGDGSGTIVISADGTAPGGTANTTSTKFSLGDKIRTIVTVSVRSPAGGTGLGTRVAGSLGSVIRGPVWVSPYWHWQIDYDGAGVDGWSAENWLQKYDSTAPPAASQPINTTITGPSSVPQDGYTKWQLAVSDPSNPAGKVNYKLNWGDGSSYVYSLLNGQSWEIGHTYTNSGTYYISVDVTRVDGTVVKKPVLTLTVVKNLPPTDLSITGPATGTAGRSWEGIEVSSYRLKATDPEGSRISYRLDCAGGSNYKAGQAVVGAPLDVTVTCEWLTPGSYTLKLTATDEQGLSSEKTFSVIVSAPQPKSPTGNNPPAISADTLVSPVNAQTDSRANWWYDVSDPDGDYVKTLFDWGDGTTTEGGGIGSVSGSVGHAYAQAGNYSIKLTVTDTAGATASKSLGITIVAAPIGSTKFLIGNQVRATADLIAASQVLPSRTTAGLQTRGVTGVVVGGPIFALNNWWWKVDFTSGADGWAAEPWLQKTSESLPANPISVSSPSSGAVWRVGETRAISWTAPPLPALTNGVFVQIKKGTKIYGSIALTVPQGTTSYTWTIPQAMNNLILEGNDFSIVIVDKDAAVMGYGSTFSILKPVGYTPGKMFVIGDRVEAVANTGIYSTPNVSPLGTHDGAGQVTNGPQLAGGYYWWEVDFDGGVDGWVVEDWLKKISSPSSYQYSPSYAASVLDSIQWQINIIYEQLKSIRAQLN